jgi:hypothetical protein
MKRTKKKPQGEFPDIVLIRVRPGIKGLLKDKAAEMTRNARKNGRRIHHPYSVSEVARFAIDNLLMGPE